MEEFDGFTWGIWSDFDEKCFIPVKENLFLQKEWTENILVSIHDQLSIKTTDSEAWYKIVNND